MSKQKALAILAAMLLLAVLAVAVAQDRPPTLVPYPGRFIVAAKPGINSYLLDRWTGRIYAIEGNVSYHRLERAGAE